MPDPDGSLENLAEALTSALTDKRALSLNDAFELGERLEYIRTSAIHQNPVRQEGEYIVGALERIERILNETEFKSTITNQVFQTKMDLINRYDQGDKLGKDDSQRQRERAVTWAGTLRQEISVERRIPVSDMGLFDVEAAMDSPETLFDADVWEWLTEQSQADIKEACRTLAVDCSTACVMLSLRAVEECLRRWYEHETGDTIEDTWGRVLGALEEEFPENRDERPAVLSNLDYLLDKRNEVMHPYESPSSEEAVTTLHMVRQNITEIYNNLN